MPSFSRQLSRFNQVVTFANSNNNLILANSIVFTDGTSLNTASGITTAGAYANAAFHQANAAYGQANTNAADIVVLQAVNVTQNTNITNLQNVNLTQNTSITNVQNSADSAFLQANAAFDSANSINGINITQNNSITAAFTQANAAYDQANTDFTNVSVLAGTYGNSTHYGVVTVAANGRVTSVETFIVQDSNSLAFAIALG